MGWAAEVADLWNSTAITTPTYVEVMAGTRNETERLLTTAFLERFHMIDEGNILLQDWQLALQYAERVPRDGKPRQALDCLIRAIGQRRGYDTVATLDTRFGGRRRSGRDRRDD